MPTEAASFPSTHTCLPPGCCLRNFLPGNFLCTECSSWHFNSSYSFSFAFNYNFLNIKYLPSSLSVLFSCPQNPYENCDSTVILMIIYYTYVSLTKLKSSGRQGSWVCFVSFCFFIFVILTSRIMLGI